MSSCHKPELDLSYLAKMKSSGLGRFPSIQIGETGLDHQLLRLRAHDFLQKEEHTHISELPEAAHINSQLLIKHE